MSTVWSPEFRELARFTAAEVMNRNDGRHTTVENDNGIETNWGIDRDTRVFASFLSEGGTDFPAHDSNGIAHTIRKMGHLNISSGQTMEFNTLAHDGIVWRKTITERGTQYQLLTEPMMLELIARATES